MLVQAFNPRTKKQPGRFGGAPLWRGAWALRLRKTVW
jgi:hypothetical protein